MMENDTRETLLRVEHLCQYFKAGNFTTKAVDDVSFDIKKGEVFGLVGESGCGKTTTGRSIIKLYNITSGNVFFKGVRICAGIQSYKDELKKTKDPARKAQLRAEIKSAKSTRNTDPRSQKRRARRRKSSRTSTGTRAERRRTRAL